jgi:hypothetical protein
VSDEKERNVTNEMSRRGKVREVDGMTVHFDGKIQSINLAEYRQDNLQIRA